MVKKKARRPTIKKAAPIKQPCVTESKNSDIKAAGFGSVLQPVFMKVCRLCEAKDGPFLNIFDADKLTAKKVDAVMPFKIAENDDLPHKICFRCSAKLEELYEFIQKCIRTQDRLQNAIGKKGGHTKVKHRELWEEKLNQSNISNDDICDALIKKAMQGIKDIPLNSKSLEECEGSSLRKNFAKPFGGNNYDKCDDISQTYTNDVVKKNLNDKRNSVKQETSIKKEECILKDIKQDILDEAPVTRSLRSNESKPNDSEKNTKPKEISGTEKMVKNTSITAEVEDKKQIEKDVPQTNTFSLNDATPKPQPTFNIMEHVSMIKVNGVGVLFQCKLCNRNFLKKQVVMSHACAKNGTAKVLGTKPMIAPDPPKISTVKYINTKINEVKKTEEEIKKTEDKPIDLDSEVKTVVKKLKPKIGPASRVRRYNEDTSTVNATATAPVVQMPSYPSLNSRYKLMAGPNNTYTLVEEKVKTPPQLQPDTENPSTMLEPQAEKSAAQPTQPDDRPYPVKLFKTLPHNSSSEQATFTTPAMKKQSYTVVQTGNPSKLLISSKPQPAEEVPKKRLRRNRYDNRDDESKKQPFSVTLEDITPAKDAGFFTFVNVDPLLQPSYVLPTDNIIQESQISTSTSISKQNIVKDADFKYSCNMCNEVFSREKKLLAHIHSHYSKMDEEDQVRERIDKPGRKRKK